MASGTGSGNRGRARKTSEIHVKPDVYFVLVGLCQHRALSEQMDKAIEGVPLVKTSARHAGPLR